MSRIRNLFHRSSSHQPGAPAVPPAPVPSTGWDGPFAAATAVAATPEPPAFAVERAHVTATNRLIYHDDPRSAAADRFRYIRMRLGEQWNRGSVRKLLVTSPLAHDGKSTVLMNLATALSERGNRSVLVVEADLHHSLMVRNLKLNAWAGLADCLQDQSISPLSSVRRVEPFGWHLLPAGEVRRNPTELLQSPALGGILEKVSACFDWVLVDSPPVLALTDAIALQEHTDASLLVVRAGETPRAAVEKTIELLGSRNIAGVVLNAVERRNQPSYQHGSQDSARKPEA